MDKVVNPAERKIWVTFARIGRILGIVGLAASPLCIGLGTFEVGLPFSIMGLRSISRHEEAKRGIALNIVGFCLSVFFLLIYIMLYVWGMFKLVELM